MGRPGPDVLELGRNSDGPRRRGGPADEQFGRRMAAVSLHDFQRLQERLKSVADPVAFLANLFAHSPVGFGVWTADGHPLLTNETFMELFRSEPPPEYNVLEGRPAGRQRAAGAVSARLRRRDGSRADVLVRPPRSQGRSRHGGAARRRIGDDLPAVQGERRDRIRGRHLQGRNRGHARARATPGAERQPGAHRAGAHRPAPERQPRARGLQLLGGARPARAAAEHEHLRADSSPGAGAEAGSRRAPSPGADQGKRAPDGDAHRSVAVPRKRGSEEPGPATRQSRRVRARGRGDARRRGARVARSRWSSPAVWTRRWIQRWRAH